MNFSNAQEVAQNAVRAVLFAFVNRFGARLVWQRMADCSYFSSTATFTILAQEYPLFDAHRAEEARRRRSQIFTSTGKNINSKCYFYRSITTQFLVLSASLGFWRWGALNSRTLGSGAPAAQEIHEIDRSEQHVIQQFI